MNPAIRLSSYSRICFECAGKFEALRPEAEFCGRECRNRWGNRRLQRGAELYDLFMASRFELEEAKSFKVWRELNRLASRFRAEDQEERAGRPSWRSPRQVLARLQDDGRLPRGDLLATNYRAGR